MINSEGIIEFENLSQALTFYTNEILKKDKIISANFKNQESYKKEIIELHPIFFKLTNPKKVIFNHKNYNVLPYWTVSEILTEMLGVNPPLMINYRQDLINWSYDLLCSGRACYQYGTRWLNHNSLEKTFKRLKDNPTSKRCYVPIFDQNDVGDTLDAPCNLGFLFLIRNNKLDLTLFTRSIDILRGFRYDFSLFSFIQQIMASWLDIEIGNFYYYCNSLHCYGQDIDKLKKLKPYLAYHENDILEININEKLEVQKTYEDFTKIIELENIIRNNKNFEVCDLKKLNYAFSRDFVRIFWLKNIGDFRLNNEIINSMETSIKTWFKND